MIDENQFENLGVDNLVHLAGGNADRNIVVMTEETLFDEHGGGGFPPEVQNASLGVMGRRNGMPGIVCFAAADEQVVARSALCP
jgi:hypothetical protein